MPHPHPRDLPISIDRDPSGALIVRGDIDIVGGPALDAAVLEFDDDADGAPVVIDLADVAFVDSSGLRALLSVSRRAQQRGAVVRLRNVGPAVRRMLDITGTAAQFELDE